MAKCHGIRQFIDIGTGLPAPDSTHEVAQRVDPWSRVVYVDNDPLVMAHARALLTSTDEGSCDYLETDLRDTEYILRQATRTLDFTQPVAVMLLAILHFIPDSDDPPGIVAALTADLAPCSFVAISHLTADFAPKAVGEAVDSYNALVPTKVVARTHAQVTELFAGLPLVAPGVVPISEWRPDTIVRSVTDIYGVLPARRRGAGEHGSGRCIGAPPGPEPSWAIVRMGDGSYRAMRDWWGNQQIIRAPDPGEMEARLQALPPCTGRPRPA
jgi:hypothetical protein